MAMEPSKSVPQCRTTGPVKIQKRYAHNDMQGSNNQTGDNESIEIKNNTISKIENPTVIQPQCHFHFGTDSEFYQAPAPKISTEISSEKLVPPGKHVQEPNKDPVQPGETLKKLELIVGLHQQEANTDPASSLDAEAHKKVKQE